MVMLTTVFGFEIEFDSVVIISDFSVECYMASPSASPVFSIAVPIRTEDEAQLHRSTHSHHDINAITLDYLPRKVSLFRRQFLRDASLRHDHDDVVKSAILVYDSTSCSTGLLLCCT